MSRFVPATDLDRVLTEASVDGRVDLAEQVKERAQARARYRTGHYRNSISVNVESDKVTVGSDDFAAHIIEWGSINAPAQAVIRSAAADMGRFEPE